MKIFDEGGALDYEAALEEIRTTIPINDERQFSRRLDLIRVAAAVDIAASLSILALEATLAMGPLDTDNVTSLFGLTEDGDDEPVTEEARDFLVVGDVVHVVGNDTEPGEVVKLGTDQGETYADVVFVGGAQERFYVRNLVRLIGEESAAEVAERVIEALDEIDPVTPAGSVAAEIPEDPDDDFEPIVKAKKKGGKK